MTKKISQFHGKRTKIKLYSGLYDISMGPTSAFGFCDTCGKIYQVIKLKTNRIVRDILDI